MKITLKHTLVLSWSILMLTSCSTEFVVDAEQSEHTYFYKAYSSPDENVGTFVDELPNGDIILAGASGPVGLNPNTFIMSRTDAFGTVVWERSIRTIREFLTQGAVMSNGDYVFNSLAYSTEVIRVTAEGEVVFHKEFDPDMTANNIIGVPAEGENGTVLISHTNGSGTGRASDNFIYTLNMQGDNERVLKLEDYDLGGKVLTFQVDKYVGGEYWVSGVMFEEPFTGWSDVMKHFVAKVKVGSRGSVYVKDSRDPQFGFHRGSLYASDNSIVTVSTKKDELFLPEPEPQSSFEILKIDGNVELKWRTKVELDVLTCEPASLTENSSGEYVVTGNCSVSGTNGRLPFVVKIGSDGVITFSKIFKLGESVDFMYGIQTQDKSYLFTGSSAGFGNSIEHSNIVVMKTDESGNNR